MASPYDLLRQVPQAQPVPVEIPEDVRQYVMGVQAPSSPAPTLPTAPEIDADQLDAALAADRKTASRNRLAENLSNAAGQMLHTRRPALALPPIDEKMREFVLKRQMSQQDEDRAYKQGEFQRAVALGLIKSKQDAEEWARRFGVQSAARSEERADERTWREQSREDEQSFRAQQAAEARAQQAELARLAREAAADARDDRAKQRQPAEQKVVDDLRKELQGQQAYKDAQTVAASYEKIKVASPTAQGDMGLIFGMMKMFDPNSVVRETEYANAQNAAGVPEKIRNAWNKAKDGQFLTPEQRAAFRAEADSIYRAQRQRFDATAKEYRRLAEKRGLPPEDVVFDVFGPAGASGSKVTVSNGTETFQIDRSDLPEAQADGFREVQ